MTYRTVRVSDLPNGLSPASEKKEIDEALGVETFGFNRYAVDPGQRVPWGPHYHPRHEEVFYVLEGELTVDTPEGAQTVTAGEALYVPPEHPNCAHNAGDERVVLIAVGGPKETDEAVIEDHCPNCETVTERTSELADGGETAVLSCAACGVETDRFSR